MPCRTYEDDAPTPSKKEDKKWEAGFCALVHAIEKHQGLVHLKGLLISGSKDGDIDLEALYEEHVQADITRLEKDLAKYSKDELLILRQLLNKNPEL